jgi:acyl-coenzyme A thioesterase PaaI-like protein
MEHAFIEHFWGNLPKTTTGGATCRVPIGPQIGNRVGHVQGGILIGLAQSTAAKAVPRHPAISNISAWYISPGSGKELYIRSSIVHAGRSFAVVRTEIKNADGKLVLEAVSNHAAR